MKTCTKLFLGINYSLFNDEIPSPATQSIADEELDNI